MLNRHHKSHAHSANELLVRGDYFEICLTKILLDVTVKPFDYKDELKRLILIELICTNLWEHRLRTFYPAPVLIDSNGFQHSDCGLPPDTKVHKSKHLRAGTLFSPVPYEIEGQAKGRGWISFPYLGKSIVPHRLIFQMQVFDPRMTCGSVRDIESLELVFDLPFCKRLLGDGKNDNFSE